MSDILFAHFDTLVGYSFTERAVRWLTWLGVTYLPRDEIGFPFRMERNVG